LSEDDDFHVGGSDEGEGAEEVFAGRKDVGGGVGFGDGGGEGGELVAGVAVVENGVPGGGEEEHGENSD
jgi:hypothetical protein